MFCMPKKKKKKTNKQLRYEQHDDEYFSIEKEESWKERKKKLNIKICSNELNG